MKLYIIGNGFDLHHNLPTSTNDFQNCVEKHDTYDYYSNSGVDWNAYEEGLSYFDVAAMAESYIESPDYLSDKESDRDGVIFQMEQIMDTMYYVRNEALKYMILTANQKIFDNRYHFINKDMFENSLILSFNYTSTIQELYNCENIHGITHIHGFFDDGDELIFGYANPEEEALRVFHPHDIDVGIEISIRNRDEDDHDDFYIHKQYQSMYDFYCSNQKKLQIDNLINWIADYKDEVDEIIVLGHSMGFVDKVYFEELEKMLKPLKWRISRYTNSNAGIDPSDHTLKCYSFFTKIDPAICGISDYLI
ncbi:AbiH family protein [Acetobacterium bakii]|nr:AbiH family protein [Acetobacterium bakii]